MRDETTHMGRQARGIAATGVLLAATLLGVGCGSTDTESSGSSSHRDGTKAAEQLSDIDLDGVVVRVGSKDFTEQLVLGYIASEALRAAGAKPSTDIGSVGTVAAREALLSGESDLYWEYTGTAWIEFLGHDRPIQDPEEQYDAVAREDRSGNDVVWLTPAPFDNTYALAMTPADAKRLDVDSISDIERVIDEHPDEASICVESEFASRRDGLPGLEDHYAFAFPPSQVHRLDSGVVYGAIGDRCTFGEVFRTDARIGGLDLDVLDDDEDFFPTYQPAVSIRRGVVERSPLIAEVFQRVAPRLDEDTMVELNRRVDVEGELPRQVAIDWLRDEGLID